MKKPKLSRIERLYLKAEDKYSSECYREAIDYLLQILESKPVHLDALSLIAYCYHELDEYQLAYDYYTRYLNSNHWGEVDWYMYGWLGDQLNITSSNS
jgi:tetratricopeptide (TPR) repeat protein